MALYITFPNSNSKLYKYIFKIYYGKDKLSLIKAL